MDEITIFEVEDMVVLDYDEEQFRKEAIGLGCSKEYIDLALEGAVFEVVDASEEGLDFYLKHPSQEKSSNWFLWRWFRLYNSKIDDIKRASQRL